jgi:hypothetical protein
MGPIFFFFFFFFLNCKFIDISGIAYRSELYTTLYLMSNYSPYATQPAKPRPERATNQTPQSCPGLRWYRLHLPYYSALDPHTWVGVAAPGDDPYAPARGDGWLWKETEGDDDEVRIGRRKGEWVMKINISKRGHVAGPKERKGTCHSREGKQPTQEEGRQSMKALQRRGEERLKGWQPPMLRRRMRGHQTSPRGGPGKQPIEPQSKPTSWEPTPTLWEHQPGEGEKMGEVGQEVTLSQSQRKGSAWSLQAGIETGTSQT